MRKEEQEYNHPKKRRGEKMVLIFILVLGIIIGGITAIYLIFPEMNSAIIKENQTLKEKNTLLEKEASSLTNCMQKKGISYYTDCK